MAQANLLTPIKVFALAAPFPKLIVIALFVSAVAAVVVLVLKLRSEQRLAGGSAYLSGLRFGGPILGGCGAWARAPTASPSSCSRVSTPKLIRLTM